MEKFMDMENVPWSMTPQSRGFQEGTSARWYQAS